MHINRIQVNVTDMRLIEATDSAAAVRAELGRKGLPKAALVPVLGLSYSAVHKRVSGDKPFTVVELSRIADFLGVPITELLGTKNSEALAGAGEAS